MAPTTMMEVRKVRLLTTNRQVAMGTPSTTVAFCPRRYLAMLGAAYMNQTET